MLNNSNAVNVTTQMQMQASKIMFTLIQSGLILWLCKRPPPSPLVLVGVPRLGGGLREPTNSCHAPGSTSFLANIGPCHCPAGGPPGCSTTRVHLGITLVHHQDVLHISEIHQCDVSLVPCGSCSPSSGFLCMS